MSADMIRARFRSLFHREPDVIGVAPGRVNLIGEHTDYNDGFVFPAAIDRGLFIAAARSDGASQVESAQLGDGGSFKALSVQKGQVDSWAKYAAGMAWALRATGAYLPDIDATLDSTIPIGSGVSSSAAIELAFGVVWRQLAGLDISSKELAGLGQTCENKFVGVNSGIMDQMACAMGKAGHAMFLDTRSLEIEYAPIPHRLEIVLCDTRKPRALTDSAYNERRSQCEEAARVLGVTALRDADLKTLEEAEDRMPEVVFRRARHVITENARCVLFKQALATSDLDQIGKLMRASHESLRDDYEVSCLELDAMAEAAWSAPGCAGARMTGAGFGGACVALVEVSEIELFVLRTLERYKAATGRMGEAMSCRPVDGAHVL